MIIIRVVLDARSAKNRRILGVCEDFENKRNEKIPLCAWAAE